MTTPSHVLAAIEDLKARRAKIDSAIAALEDLFGLASTSTPAATSPRPHGKANGYTSTSADDDAILAHLKAHGWTKPRELADALDRSPAVLRLSVKALLKAKRLVAIGKTNTRRLALAGTPPPKEAP
jgi:hypothetical protein